MNRDEQRTRSVANPPAVHRLDEHRAVHPSEPGGGTWIALNDAGVTLALVNWYAVTRSPPANATPHSRGDIIVRHRHAQGPADLQLSAAPLRHTRPFRLVVVFPVEGLIQEWRWDLDRLTRIDHDWNPAQWISSGRDEPGAQRSRGAVFSGARTEPEAGSSSWLRRLHASHAPACGAYSTCVHRDDAATVSYTEIEVSPEHCALVYFPGAPCENAHVRHPPTISLNRTLSGRARI